MRGKYQSVKIIHRTFGFVIRGAYNSEHFQLDRNRLALPQMAFSFHVLQMENGFIIIASDEVDDDDENTNILM